MDEVSEVIKVSLELFGFMFDQAVRSLALALVGGMGVVILMWVGAACCARLWNRQYRLRAWQHFLCLVAALVTLFFALLWSATSYVTRVADTGLRIVATQGAENVQRPESFVRAFAAVQTIGIEDFSEIPAPDMPGTHIPLTHAASKDAVASIYAQDATHLFERSFPHLQAWVRSGSQQYTAKARVLSHVEETGAIYPTENVTGLILSSMAAGLSRWVWKVRLSIGGLFVFVQTVLFSIVSLAAYRGIKIHT